MERVCIFIDGSNLYHGLIKLTGSPYLNYQRFSELLSDGRKLIRVYYYNSPVNQDESPESYKKQQKFFSYLNHVPYLELRLGRLVTRSKQFGGIWYSFSVEKGVDVYLATDMLKYAFYDTYDTAILVSGDGDYADAVRAVKEKGKQVELAHFKTGDSEHLKTICDLCFLIDSAFIAECNK